ncbi:MAG: hypothetical protein ACTSRS_05415 [Candidatus Helarchaeota archaeon]
MKFRCEGCTNYCREKRLPDYQATFHNWCELFQTPSVLIRKCDYLPPPIQNPPQSKIEARLNEFFNIFAKRPPQSPPFQK